MIFEILNKAADNGELILVNDGLCHWHLRRDGQITIHEIIVLPEKCKRGIGTMMLEQLKQVAGATSIFAKCPMDLEANRWYQKIGFRDEGIETTKTGRQLRKWRLNLLPRDG